MSNERELAAERGRVRRGRFKRVSRRKTPGPKVPRKGGSEPEVTVEKLTFAHEQTVLNELKRYQGITESPGEYVPRDRLGSSGASYRRSIPVTIYISEEGPSETIESAVTQVLDSFDLGVTHRLPPVRGSWYRAFVARTKKVANSPELKARLEKVERAIEIQALHRHQAQIDSAQGDAVAKLITALGVTPNAIIQIGSVLLVKVDNVLAVRNLTQRELGYLENNPGLLREPSKALYWLQQVAEGVDSIDQPLPLDDSASRAVETDRGHQIHG